MSFALNDDQRRTQDLVRRVAQERVASRAAAIDAAAEYPQDMFDLLKELGLFTLPFPAEYGGSSSMLSACVAIEEFGRVCYNTAYLLIVQWTPFGAIIAPRAEATVLARPGERRSPRSLLDHGAAERFRCCRHQDPRRPLRGWLPYQWR